MNVQTQNFGEITLINFTELTEDDLRYVLKMRNHPEIKKWMYSQNDITEEQHFSFVDSLKKEATKRYFLVKKSDSLVGVIYFTDMDYEKRSLAFGLYANVFDKPPKAGSILVESALEFVKNNPRFNKVLLEVFEDNEVAIALYKKFKFLRIKSKVIKAQNVILMTKEMNE